MFSGENALEISLEIVLDISLEIASEIPSDLSECSLCVLCLILVPRSREKLQEFFQSVQYTCCFVNNTVTYFNLFVCPFKKRDVSVM